MAKFQIQLSGKEKIQVEVNEDNIKELLKDLENQTMDDPVPFLRESSIFGKPDFDRVELKRIVGRIYKLLSLTEDNITFSETDFLKAFLIPLQQNSESNYFAFVDDIFLAHTDPSKNTAINQNYRSYVKDAMKFFDSFEELLSVFKGLNLRKLN